MAILMFAFLCLMMVTGVLMYFIEGKTGGFASIPQSIYWAIETLTTIGYGDIVPQTNLGRMIQWFIKILGISATFAIIVVPFVFLFKMLIDCLQRSSEDFPNKRGYNKLIWSLSIIFLNFIGAVMYYFLVKMQDNRRRQT